MKTIEAMLKDRVSIISKIKSAKLSNMNTIDINVGSMRITYKFTPEQAQTFVEQRDMTVLEVFKDRRWPELPIENMNVEFEVEKLDYVDPDHAEFRLGLIPIESLNKDAKIFANKVIALLTTKAHVERDLSKPPKPKQNSNFA